MTSRLRKHLSAATAAVLLTSVCAITQPSAAFAATWRTSKMSGAVGVLDDTDATIWCLPYTQTTGGPIGARGSLTKVNSDGTSQENYVSSSVEQRVRIQCFANANLTGSSTTYTSGWSSDKTSTSPCPSSRPYAGFLRCQVRTSLKTPFVYAGTSCGNGITSVSPNPATCAGQVTGQAATICAPLINDTSAQGGVFGTDVAATFYEGGKQYFAFGDTCSGFEDTNGDGEPDCLDWRSNTVAWGSDFDPATGGIAISGWEHTSGNPSWAVEAIPSAHQPGCTGTQEISKIPGAGFGYFTSGTHQSVIWYTSVNCWDATADGSQYWMNKASHSAFAYQTPNGYWMPWSPRWETATANFHPGAIWVNRINGDVYLFGVAWYGGGVRLARVSTMGASSPSSYKYWNGSTWVADSNGDGQEAAPGKTAYIIPNSPGLRAEMSVVWNSYVNRFMLMGLRWRNGGGDGVTLELWQSPTPAANASWPDDYLKGTWKRIATSYAPGYYAPMLSESYLMNGGKDAYFLLSNWTSYNVALYNFSVNRSTIRYCDTADN